MKRIIAFAKPTGFIVMTAPTGRAEGWMVEFFKRSGRKFGISRSSYVTIIRVPFCDIHIYRNK